MTRARTRFAPCVLALAPLLLTGCGRAPAVDILGSFFPGWLVCLVAAFLLTAIGRLVLLRFHLNFDLPVVAYPSLTAFFTFALWLIFFH
jgi:YtcA family